MLRFLHSFLPVLLLAGACDSRPDARQIIAEAIEAHGGDNYQNVRVEFDFRHFHLNLQQRDGKFRYERTHRDSTGADIREMLTNTDFARSVNGQRQTLDSAAHSKWSNAVNAVAYFALLPYKLGDPAVLTEYLGESTIEGQKYDKIRVRFRAEGGGKDFQDTFFYWFNQRTHTMDYLSYSEGGPRFRKAINPQTVGGIRFQDYINYTVPPGDTATNVGDFDQKYVAKKLVELSRIEQKNVRVSR
ncbi:MAG: hypothetical protein LH606_21140 [Cytophagaceae bacterium]|nr:hypothetical protein [Cytophagaceae bacterium]